MKISAAKPSFPEDDVDSILKDIKETLRSGWLTSGPRVRELEERFAKYVGVKHAIATNSGTAALTCALKALGVQDTVVLVPDATFAATAHAVLWNGASVSLVDIDDSNTFNIGLSSLEEEFSRLTRSESDEVFISSVVVVHVAGHPVDMDPIIKFCREHELFLVEDAAHAHGSEYKGKKCGSLSDLGCFSFYPTKLMTSAEGGVVTTDDDDLAEKCRVITNQGRGTLYTNDIVLDGFNFRLSDVHAAIGIHQLKHLDEWIKHRRGLARLYTDLLEEIEWVQPPVERNYAKSNYFKFVCLLRKDFSLSVDEIQNKLKERGVSCGMSVYWPPLHRTTFYGRRVDAANYPVAEDVLSRQLCLPMYSSMSEEEVHYVVEQLSKVGG